MKPENEEQGAVIAEEVVVVVGSSSSSSSANGVNNTGKSKHPSTNFIGRHRLQAAISLLEQQIQTFQDELKELETMDGPSTVCPEMISGIESAPDPLLPMTKGPEDVNWERWFGGASSSRSHRRWI